MTSNDIEKYPNIEIHESNNDSHFRTIHPANSLKNENKEKQTEFVQDSDILNEDNSINQLKSDQGIKRNLKARHISLIALGGTIGTGLFISTGSMIATSGPVLSLISFLFMTTIAFSVTQSLGEMATLIPVSGSFAQFVTRWVSKPCGAANGWLYWFSWAITFALELSVVGQVIQFWTDAVPLWAWITIFFVVLTLFNFLSVSLYGELEFWIASIKIVAIVGWLIYAFIMVCGAGKTGPVGFRYWRNGYAWGPGYLVKDVATGRFLGWVKSLINAAFTFQGTELTGISAGESANPRKTVPSAIRKVLFRILVFFVLCMLFLGLLVPYNDPKLNSDGYTNTSPFIIAIQNSGTKVLPHIFNAVILSTIISAGNSDVYCGSRILYALAEAKVAPKFFLRTNRFGVPYVAVSTTAIMGALGYLALSPQGNEAFDWLLDITATAGLICWGFISVSHIRFMKVLKIRNISRDTLPFKAKFMPWNAYYACFFVFLITLIQGFDVFWNITASKFFTAYVSVIIFVVFWVGFHFLFHGFTFRWKDILIPLDDCDIDSGVREIDELEFDEPSKPKNLWEKFWAVVA
ncbi:unnamed protein product [Candida verbasci]|uniref:Amino acid permease/ SLC12A domain-containing protein n=1 Tax=Candida verbasci TaxID=1227364 RepID=A0A9W4XFL7_9ASCO|nr:unnamed protein product [Candida verbasci]